MAPHCSGVHGLCMIVSDGSSRKADMLQCLQRVGVTNREWSVGADRVWFGCTSSYTATLVLHSLQNGPIVFVCVSMCVH